MPHVVFYSEHSSVGGAGVLMKLMAEGAAAHGFQTTVAVPDSRLAEFACSEIAGVSVVTLPAVAPAGGVAANVSRLVRPSVQFARLLRRLEPDIVHISNGGYPGSDLCRSAAITARVPTLMSIHAVPSPLDPERSGLHRAFDRLVWRSVDRVIMSSEAVREGLVAEREMPPEKARVIPNAVPDRAIDSAAATRLRAELAPNGSLHIGLVSSPGSNLEWKGYGAFAEAVGRLPADMPVAITVVGEDPGADYEERLAAARCAPRVQRTGPVGDPLTYIAALDVLCVPSIKFEGVPLTILEAMAACVAVVASRISGIPEVVRHEQDGLICAPGDVEALAEALQRLGTATERERFGSAGRARFEERYTAERMVESVLEVYSELL